MTAPRPPAEFYERLWRAQADAENASRWSFQQALVDRALDWLGDIRQRWVLEIGPGIGRETAALVAGGAHALALDVTLAALERTRAGVSGAAPAAASTGVLHPVQALAERLPLRDGSIDRVFAQTVLMHLDLSAAAGEWARVLRPGGRVIVLEPVRGNPLVWLHRRFISPYRVTRPNYVTVAELETVSPDLKLLRHEEHFLLSVAVLALPPPLARVLRPVLARVDRALLVLPFLRRFAWMTLAEWERKAGAGQVPASAHRPPRR